MIQLDKLYRHVRDENIRAVPFAVNDDTVELTLDRHGTLETGAMSIGDFLEQFQLVNITD